MQIDASDLETVIEIFYGDKIDLLWLSPPCKAYSTLSHVHHDDPKSVHPTFYDLNIRGVIHYLEPENWIIENVANCDDLKDPTRVNGYGVGYDFGLERHFETSFDCPDALGNGEPAFDMSSGIGNSYVEVAKEKGVPAEWGKDAVRSAIPFKMVQYLLHHCPSVPDVGLPKDNNGQVRLTDYGQMDRSTVKAEDQTAH